MTEANEREKRKTCDRCKPPEGVIQRGRIVRARGLVELCPKHALFDELVEALEDYQRRGSQPYFERIGAKSARLLAKVKALQ